MKHKHKKWIPVFVLLGVGAAFLFGWIVQLLWNATITPIFSTNPVSYWQAVMVLILSKILFSSHYKVHKEKHKEWCHPKPKFICKDDGKDEEKDTI